jgi:ppGpp synthetase/RelA/SpoT-type nucleotidyltranferase
MNEIDSARKRWREDRQKYEEFGKLVERRTALAVTRLGICCEASSRAKEVHSLVKKLLGGDHNYENLADKVGARCIVRYLSEVECVVALVGDLFVCSEPDRKVETKLQEDRVGYISTHIEVRLKDDDPESENYPPEEFWAELQVRTLAQHVWAEMSHSTVYKDEESIARLPDSMNIKRRVNLMAGLIEVADREFDRVNGEIQTDPAAAVYKALERHYYKLTVKRPDVGLSMQVIKLLLPLYKDDVSHITQQIDHFVAANEQLLTSIYEGADEWGASALLYQPEALMLFERLQNDQFALRQAWNSEFPERELERIANDFGVSFD